MQGAEAEKWRSVPGTRLEASSHGRVRFGDEIAIPNQSTKYGHLRVQAGGVRIQVHQAVARAFHGRAPVDKTLVRHLDGNPRNNRPENLRWGTPFENAQDMIAHGTTRRRTKCRKGHGISGDNVFTPTDGRARCRTCISNALDIAIEKNLSIKRGWRSVPQLEQISQSEWNALIQSRMRE